MRTRRSCGARQAASWLISVRVHARALAIAGHGQHADVREVDDDGLAAQRRAAVHHLARLLQRLRLVLGERVHPQVELDVAVERHVAGAQAHVEEVVVVGPALPDVLALDEQRPQAAGVRIQACERPALQLPGLGELGLALAQVLRVPARLGRRPLAHAPLLRPADADRGADHQHDHRPGDVEERAVAVDEREAEHPDAADHGHEHLDDRGVRGRGLRRRSRYAQPLRGHGLRILARRSMEGQRVLCCHLRLRLPRQAVLHAAVFVRFRPGTRHFDVQSEPREAPGCPTSQLRLNSFSR